MRSFLLSVPTMFNVGFVGHESRLLRKDHITYLVVGRQEEFDTELQEIWKSL